MDFFVSHGSSLCKQITEVLEDEELPIHEGEIEKRKLLFDGKCMRQSIRDDLMRVYELMEGPIKV